MITFSNRSGNYHVRSDLARNGKRLTMEQGLDWAAKWKQVNDALGKVSADCHYDEWIKIGMAIHSWLPDSVGMELWNKWSQTCPERYPGEKTIKDKWRSFKPGGGITIGTLFGKAGFKKEELLDYGMPIELAVEVAAEWDDDLDEVEAIYDFAPWDSVDIYDLPEGLAKELFNFLCRWNLNDMPLYALSMAIIAGGFIKRNYAQTSTRLRTNLMALIVGPSSTGKSEVGEAMKRLLIEVEMNQYIRGKIASVSGIELFLQDPSRHASLFQIVDEARYDFEAQANRNCPIYLEQIRDFRLEAFKCSAIYECILSKAAGIKDVLHPFYSFIGFTTPDVFPKFKKEDLTNGYFPRHLLFYVKEKGSYTISDQTITTDLKNYIKGYKHLTNNAIVTRIAEFDDAAENLVSQFRDCLNELRKKSEDNQDSYSAFFDRGVELARKVALVLTDPQGDQKDFIIGEHSMRIAIGIVVLSIKNWIHVARHYMSGNLNEAMLKDVYLKITEMPSKIGDHWILYRALSNKGKCQEYDRKDLLRTVRRLQEDGKIDVVPNKHYEGSVILRSRMHGIPQTDPNQLITDKRKRKKK